jgi:hypothetical protein
MTHSGRVKPEGDLDAAVTPSLGANAELDLPATHGAGQLAQRHLRRQPGVASEPDPKPRAKVGRPRPGPVGENLRHCGGGGQ